MLLGSFASCSKDQGSAPTIDPQGETTIISLNAEMSLDDDDLRALEYQMGTNAQGQQVPVPEFTDGQKVPVHTFIKSSFNERAIKTIEWTYVAKTKTLHLMYDDPGNDLGIVTNLNNMSGRKWYLSGMIGGQLNGTKVQLNGTKVLTESDGSLGCVAGKLDVPYYFPWTELTIEVSKGLKTGSTSSYKYAHARAGEMKTFKPLGALIGYNLGNAVSGSNSLTLENFHVSSNVFGDQGSFELNNTVTVPQPVWSPESCTDMTYTFTSTPTPITEGTSSSKYYYAWVMPTPGVTDPARTNIRVRFASTPFQNETDEFKRDDTRFYFTDYVPNATTGGKVVSGKVYKLKTNATKNIKHPMQHVTKSDLAGGPSLTYDITNYIPKPAGVQGALRFTPNHNNDQSGYYNWHIAKGDKNANYNSPPTKKLADQTLIDTDGSSIILGTKYRVPYDNEWWGVFPQVTVSWTTSTSGIRAETMKVGEGLGATALLQGYTSEYSAVSTDGNDAVFYAIRFTPKSDCATITEQVLQESTRFYTPARDDMMKCAYRFRRVGNDAEWASGTSLTTHMVIDAVYLGPETTATTLATVSTPAWWTAHAGKVISRTFPASGFIMDTTTGWAGPRATASKYN